MDTTGIRKELVEYITSGIVPLYAGFDPAHREDHAEAVMENSLKLYRTAPGVPNIYSPDIGRPQLWQTRIGFIMLIFQ